MRLRDLKSKLSGSHPSSKKMFNAICRRCNQNNVRVPRSVLKLFGGAVQEEHPHVVELKRKYDDFIKQQFYQAHLIQKLIDAKIRPYIQNQYFNSI